MRCCQIITSILWRFIPCRVIWLDLYHVYPDTDRIGFQCNFTRAGVGLDSRRFHLQHQHAGTVGYRSTAIALRWSNLGFFLASGGFRLRPGGHRPPKSCPQIFDWFRSALFIEGFWGPEICLECVGGRGFAPDPAGGAHDAPPDPLVGWGGDTHSQEPHASRRHVSSVYPPNFLAIHH